MKKKFTFLMAAVMLLMMVLPWNAVGQTKGYEELFTIASADVVTNSSYAAYNTTVSSRDYVITFGGNNKSVGTNSNNRSKCNLSSYSKYAVSPVTTSSVASAYACKTSISDVTKISYTFNGGSNQTNTNVYVLYSSDNTAFSQITLTSGTQGAAISSGTAYEFAGCSGYFALLFVATNSSGNWRIDDVNITFYKTTYTVTYNANGADNGTAPSAAAYDAGANVTVATNSGSLEKIGFSFTGWNTDPDGEGTHYDAGTGTISAISANVTLYAEWTSTSTPSIVANGGTNTLGIACTATTTGTIPVAFNNMDGFTSETVSLYNNSDCSGDPIVGGWLYDLSITGDPKNTINYKATVNEGVARTVYMRVSASYNSTTYYSNVVAITQAAPTFTVTYDKNGGTGTNYTTPSYAYGTAVTVLAVDDSNVDFTAPDGKVFDFWSTASTGTGENYDPNDVITINDNVTLYARWADMPTYTLVTNVNDIVPGAHYLIASSGAENDNSAKAMGSQGDNNRSLQEVKIEDNTIEETAGVYVFVISGYANNYTIYDVTNTGYLYAASSSKNYLRTQTTNDNNGKWSISIDGTTGAATIVAQGSNTNKYMRYNSGTCFSCYGSGSSISDPVYIYKKNNDNDIHPYSSSEYSSEVTISDDITLSSDYTLTVANGGVLTLTGSVSCSNASWLVVEDGGQLIIPNSGSKTDVKATFQKDITAYNQTQPLEKDHYYLIANPTTGNINPTTVDGMLDNSCDLYYFDEAQSGAEWRNYKQKVFNLENGKGYLYANSSNLTLEFPGTVPTGTTANITLSKSGSGTYKGFNLVGNPLSNNVTSMKIGELSCSYYKVNSSTGVFAVSTDPIIVGEAFMVEAPSNGATLRLNPSAKDEAGFTNEVIRLEVANSKFTDVAYVYFGNHLPLTKINHLNDEAPMLYIHNENSDKAVEVYNNRGEVKSINVNFEAKTMGAYTISAKMVKGEIKYMHLYDRLTGIDTDLLIDDYSFIGAKEDQPGRFILSLEATDNEFEGSENFAYQSGNNIIVSGEGELHIFDVTGRMIMNTNINGAETVSVPAQGVYIFRLVGNDIKTQKIVVR